MEKKILEALSPTIVTPIRTRVEKHTNIVKEQYIDPQYLQDCTEAVHSTLTECEQVKSDYVACGPRMVPFITESKISCTGKIQNIPLRQTKTWEEVKKLLQKSNIVSTFITFYLTGQGKGHRLFILTTKGEQIVFHGQPNCTTVHITNYGMNLSPASQHTLQFVIDFLLQNNWSEETLTGYHPSHGVKLVVKFIQDYLVDQKKQQGHKQRQKQTSRMPSIDSLFQQTQQQPPIPKKITKRSIKSSGPENRRALQTFKQGIQRAEMFLEDQKR